MKTSTVVAIVIGALIITGFITPDRFNSAKSSSADNKINGEGKYEITEVASISQTTVSVTGGYIGHPIPTTPSRGGWFQINQEKAEVRLHTADNIDYTFVQLRPQPIGSDTPPERHIKLWRGTANGRNAWLVFSVLPDYYVLNLRFDTGDTYEMFLSPR